MRFWQNTDWAFRGFFLNGNALVPKVISSGSGFGAAAFDGR